MGITRFDGTLHAGPPNVSDGTFPASTMGVPINLTPNPKGWQRATGVLYRAVNVPSPDFLELDGIGSDRTVSEGNFLYLRSNSTVTVRVTQAFTTGEATATFKINGLCILEFPEAEPLTLVEVQGSSTIEYFAQGQR